MECPHCHQPLPSLLCPQCGARTPEDSLFCFQCGKPVQKEKKGDDEVDFSQRVLCSDGNCIGIINEQRVCNLCGKPYTGNSV
jgi:predicted amidophosphoribosyltransferase